MEYAVRPANAMDAQALFTLNELFNGPSLATVGEMEKIIAAGGTEIVYVAEAKGRVVAFCCAQVTCSFCYREPQGEVTEMYVLPDCRRHGIAGALLAAVEAALYRRGVREVRLLTGWKNTAARKAYEAAGYVHEIEAVYIKDLAAQDIPR